MKKLHFVLTCLILFVSGPFLMQAQKGMTKIVVDSRTKLPVDYVFVSSNDDHIKLLSNKEGKFILIPDSKVKSFSFYKMGYQKNTLNLPELLKADTIFLAEQPLELTEIVIKNKKIDTIVKDKRFYVDDYLVLANGDFLLLTSKINIPGFEVCYYDRLQGIKKVRKIKKETNGHFVTDCLKNVHLLTDDFSRQVFFDSDSSFEFLPKYKRALFDSSLAACVLKVDSQLVLKYTLPSVTISLPDYDVQQSSPILSYYLASKNSRHALYTVFYNAEIRSMIQNELNDWALMNTPIDARVANNIALFFRKVAAPLYAPLYLKNDTIVLFNFQEYKILFFNKTGSVLSEVAMDRDQFLTLRDFEVFSDPVKQTFYLKQRESERMSLKRINIYTGSISKTIKLEKIFARNIQIVNDRIYYLVREKEWDDTQYLYQQN